MVIHVRLIAVGAVWVLLAGYAAAEELIERHKRRRFTVHAEQAIAIAEPRQLRSVK